MLPDTAVLEYDNEKHKQFLIDMFANYGYRVVTGDYLESKELNKGIVLKQKVIESDYAVLTPGVI